MIKLILIAGFWFNPVFVAGLIPEDEGRTCHIQTSSFDQMSREVPVSCTQVAQMLTGK